MKHGVIQGCSLSVYLFILALEKLPTKIRSDKHIKCIKKDNKEIKISLLLLHDLD